MTREKIPYFTVRDRGAAPLYYWEPGPKLRDAGWPFVKLAEHFAGPERARRRAAEEEARRWNDAVAGWRRGEPMDPATGAPIGADAAAKRPRRERPPAPAGTVQWLADRYEMSPEFADLAAATKKGYRRDLAILTAWAGDKPAGAISAKAAKTLYQTLRTGHPTKAKHVVVMGRILWAWGQSESVLHQNPWRDVRTRSAAREPGRLWSDAEVAHMVATADKAGVWSMGDAIFLNAWCAQRPTDVIALPWLQLVDGTLRLRQSKTGRMVTLPASLVPALAVRLDAIRERQRAMKPRPLEIIVSEATGRAYLEDHFRHVFADVRATAAKTMPSCAGLKFRHLRHTGFTRMLEAGVELPEACAISGHSLNAGYAIADVYGVRTEKLARAAFRRRLAAEATAEEDDDDDL